MNNTREERLTLYELNTRVRRVLELGMTEYYWIKAEVSTLQVAYNGHCYMDLIQKEENTNSIIAKARANVWRTQFVAIRERFEKTTGIALTSGITLLLKVAVTFHEQYGYALVVYDIDPYYTLGDVARRRMEIIQMLKDEGLFDQNRTLPLAMLPKRVAVISSATAAGYGDFKNQIENNPYGYAFELTLFAAVMQGDRAEQSIIAALQSIAQSTDNYDVVVIIRGGGAASDLNCFDSYALAVSVACFPIPIVTGIGHERDDTVIDMISYRRVKTPTAAAELLIGLFQEAEAILEDLDMRMRERVRSIIEMQSQRLMLLSQKLPGLYSLLKIKQENRLNELLQRIVIGGKGRIDESSFRLERQRLQLEAGLKTLLLRHNHNLKMVEQRVEVLSPERVLNRGYSMTRLGGKLIKSVDGVKSGDIVESHLVDGVVRSMVIDIIKQGE